MSENKKFKFLNEIAESIEGKLSFREITSPLEYICDQVWEIRVKGVETDFVTLS